MRSRTPSLWRKWSLCRPSSESGSPSESSHVRSAVHVAKISHTYFRNQKETRRVQQLRFRRFPDRQTEDNDREGVWCSIL